MGALGPVFRTYEPTRDRLVAVKVFRLDITPEQAQQLADELATAADAGLFHPSIVEPIAAGVEGTAAYRAEEYVAAEGLDIAVRHYAPATVEKVLPFITQMAGAIDFARTAGVGHGALHPRDVFVTPEEARITGFGVVEALQRVGIRAPVRRPYSAPERVSSEAWGTPADVFSLAAISYELLTGRRPSGVGRDIDAEGLTPVVHAVLARALDEDPAARYQTALAFASALDAAGHGAAPDVVAPATRQSKKGRAAAAAMTAAAAAAAATPPKRPDPDEAVEQIPPREDLDDRRDPVAAEQEEDEFRREEPEFDDVSAERDEDEAHLALMREEHERAQAAETAQSGMLFDEAEDEAVEDLALDAHARSETNRFADEFMVAAVDEPDVAPGDHQPGRPSAIDSLRDEVRGREPRITPADARQAAEREEDAQLYGGIHAPLGGYAPAPPPVHDRARSPMLAIAIVVVLGLLVGFLAGRAVGIQEGIAQARAEMAGGAADTQGGTRVDEPKPFSEQQVTTPPPADPPPVVSEGPPASDPAPAGSKPTTPDAPPSTEKPAPARATAGRLVVDSTPRGASVTVDKRWLGRTPLTLNDVAFGRHEVRVVQNGYETGREEVTLSEATPTRTLSFRLKRTAPATRGAARTNQPPAARPAAPQSYTGSMYVDSRPRGARVYLDGKMVGVTPIRIPDVAIGSHVIRLQLEAHRDWTSSARVVAGEERRVTGSLDPIR